ncbi:CheY-like chemotaxis protein [Oxalobacteraceae bacterium GrIS 1.18]
MLRFAAQRANFIKSDTFDTLQNDVNTEHFPVIRLSSDAFPGDIKKTVQARFCHKVTKPFTIEDLMNTID